MDGALVQVTNKQVVYRASALGTPCTKALVAARQEYTELPPPKNIAKAYQRGHDYEPVVLEEMKKYGWIVYGQQETVELNLTGNIMVRGHIDGKGVHPQLSPVMERRVVEVKTQTDTSWKDFERNGWESGFFPKYKWQTSAYMHATGLKLVLVRYNVETGEMGYEWIDEAWYGVDEIRRYVLGVEGLARTEVLPDECDARYYPCPFFYLHGDEDMREMVDDEHIESLARERDRARIEAKTAEQRRKEADKALSLALGGPGKYQTVSGVKVSVWEAQTQARLPQRVEQGLRAGLMYYHGVDLEQCKTRGKYERVSVTLPKEELDGE